jgi:hypothetical protein
MRKICIIYKCLLFICHSRLSGHVSDYVILWLIHLLHKVKGGYDRKAFRRLHNALLSLFDMHLSEVHIRLKVPSGEYGSIFVAFKRFFIMFAFHFENIFCNVYVEF